MVVGMNSPTAHGKHAMTQRLENVQIAQVDDGN